MRSAKKMNDIREVRVFAPATVTNVSCGFDILGFALNRPGDEVVIRKSSRPGARIVNISGCEKQLPLEMEQNTAGKALQSFLFDLGWNQGFELEIYKRMAIGTGLGSSAASAVAAVYGLNQFLEEPLSLPDLLPFALEGEKLTSNHQVHADNVAASLYGGFIIVRSIHPLEIVPIDYPQQLVCVIVHPHIELPTAVMRRILRNQIELKDAVHQWGNIAALVAGLQQKDLGLISRSLEDVIVEPTRGKVIPGYEEVRQSALENGALGCGISGSGPSIFALCTSFEQAENSGRGMQEVYRTLDIESDLYISAINDQGAKVVSVV